MWSPPTAEDRNGPLTGYVVQLTEVASGRTIIKHTTETSFQWDSLHPHYTYMCRVAAKTRVGNGPYTPNATVIMPEAGKPGYGTGSSQVVAL